MAKQQKIIMSFNAGELSPEMDSRIDQNKYIAGCRTMENFAPRIYGGAERRPGLEFIATQKNQLAKGRVVAFEHSVDDTYILLFENQVMRVFRNGGQVLDDVGTEVLTALNNIVAHWKLNDDAPDTVVVDAGATHNGVASANTEDIHADGKVGTGSFDLDGTYAVAINDADTLSFDDSGTNPFSIAAWVYVEELGALQVILSKWKEDTAREWRLSLDSTRKLQLHLSDDSVALSGNTVAQWKLNDNAADTNVAQSGKTYAIDAVNTTAETFTITNDGDLSDSFPDSSEFTVAGSTGNDGQWVVSSTSWSSPNFVITVTGNITDATADGTAAPHAGVASTNSATLNATGKINDCFDFDGQYNVVIDDSADFSFGNGSNDSAFSIAAWVYVSSTESEAILSKWNYQGADTREWYLRLVNKKFMLLLYDESVNIEVKRETNDELTNGWHFVCATYDGTGGSSAADGITLYVDGIAVSSGTISPATYVAMENTSALVRIGAYENSAGNPGAPFQDKIDNVILFDKELTVTEVLNLWNNGAGTEGLSTTFPHTVTDNALGIGWHFVCATYVGTGGATAATGILLYVDGVLAASTAHNHANYVAMENTATKVRIGAQESSAAALQHIWKDKIDNVALFSDVLTADEIAALYSTIPLEIATPYLTADLPALKFEPSADVLYITHPKYEERKLSRINHTVWTLVVLGLEDGPFRVQNTDLSATITASATTGNIILTASGGTPFIMGTTSGHSPSGSAATSKSQTGALFKLVHALSGSDQSVATELDTSDATSNFSSELTVYKGVKWDFTTNGTWGTADNSATVILEREYGNSGVWETVVTVTSAANKNVVTSGTEEVEDAQYRASVFEAGGDSSKCSIQLSVRDTSHIGIVKITAVASSTSATATVLATIGSTDATHRWSEGSFSNYRGWPIDVVVSPEERLTFAGSVSDPLTTWGSVVGIWTSFKEGVLADDAITFTLIGSGQQNKIRWALSKNSLILGTVGGEHLLGASDNEEALTPTNVKAKLQTTHGSENIAAHIINQAVIFLQRGGRKIREFLYNFEADSHKADDLTVFSNHITKSGIVDMAFQRVPDPTLWCIRSDGELACMTYERDQDVYSWYRIVTHTNLAGTYSDSDFESVAVIYGGANSEDEVWVTVRRTIGGVDKRYVERFNSRDMPSDIADMKYLDSYITDTGGDTTITGLDHLKGQTVQVLGDGLVQATKVVNGSGEITAATTAAKYQVGVGYISTLKPMKLDIARLGLATTKKISRAIINLYNTIGGEVGTTTSDVQSITGTTGTAALFEGLVEVPMPGGYSREGDIIVRQTDPLPMTVLSLTLDVGASND